MEFFSIMENRVDQLIVVKKKRKYVCNMRGGREKRGGGSKIEFLSE